MINKKLGKVYNFYYSVGEKFFASDGFMQASALTFYTLFAIVPIVAVAFSIAKRVGLKMLLDIQLKEDFPGQEKAIDAISRYAQTLIDQTKDNIVAAIGLVVLFYSIYRMLSHVESAFNRIWSVKTPRGVFRKISHYSAILLFGPIIFLASFGLKFYMSKKLHEYSSLLAWSSTALSLLLLIALFSWLYQYVPNTKVKTRVAIFGGIHAAILFMIFQTLLVKFQLAFSNYGAIYGSLAALPIFLIWVQISWEIVLFGAQLCNVKQTSRPRRGAK